MAGGGVMDAAAKRRQAVKHDAALFDSLGIPRPASGAAREGLTRTVRFDEGDEGAARTARGREALQRGKTLSAPWPDWQGAFPRRAADVSTRGIQPGRCCRCGRPGRTALFDQVNEDLRDQYKVMPWAMDWCGKGRCDHESEAQGPAVPVEEIAPAIPDPVGGLPAVGPVAAPDPVVKVAA